jgi:hypothetical protein
MSSDMSTIQNDLQTDKNDAAHGPGSDCYGISGTVDYDVTGTIEYDVNGSFQYDLNQSTNAISVARGDITTLNNDLSSLSASGLPAPSGASLPSPRHSRPSARSARPIATSTARTRS